MHRTYRTLASVILGCAAAATFITTAYGQAPSILGAPSEANHFIETPKGWVQAKTPWGDPDLQGTGALNEREASLGTLRALRGGGGIAIGARRLGRDHHPH